MKKIQITILIVSILSIGSYFSTIHASNDQTTTEQKFQPADGSMTNGTYFTTENTAKTILHNYDNVIAIDGTTTTPTLNAQGKYINSENVQLNPVGSYRKNSNDSGKTKTYYIFGSISKKEDDSNTQTNNSPIQTYNSQEN